MSVIFIEAPVSALPWCLSDFILHMLVMATLCNRAGHYIFILWFLLLSILFPHLISAITDCMSATLPHMVWP